MARVSSDEQAKGYSLDVQDEALTRYCERNGIEIVSHLPRGPLGQGLQPTGLPSLPRTSAKRSRGGIDLLLFTTWDRFSTQRRWTPTP
jgi:site-specific DNA recombinase